MNCPLCDKELVPKVMIDPRDGKLRSYTACPTIHRQILTGEKVCHFWDISHYQLWDITNDVEGVRSEVAYVSPYRIHNIIDENRCEVSDCSDKIHEGTAVLFKCGLIKITSADTLRQRIKNLVIFS